MNPDNDELIKIEHSLSMIHFLAKEYDKVYNLKIKIKILLFFLSQVQSYTDLLESKQELNESIKSELKKVIKFIRMK